MLSAKCHLGTQNLNHRMKPYVFTRRADGVHLIHLGKTWEKIMLAARILAILPSESIYVTSSATQGRRPAIKLAHFLAGLSNQGRFVPGTFTNTLEEVSCLVAMDPMTDYQAIKETGYCNMPVIALCNTHTSLRLIDVAIPCNNQGTQSIGLVCWLLARTVLRLRGQLDYKTAWDVMPDMFFYTEQPEERLVEEQEADQSNFYFAEQSNDMTTEWDASPAVQWDTPKEQMTETHWNLTSSPTTTVPSPPPTLWADDVATTEPSEGWGSTLNTSPTW
ncbi:ribosomal protein S2, flavodoxin-like domain-containing protein [Blakeslea trispora]|nr:ribosomal protein S2, flavodoxin-like domain-containing protein [Blakeslea trispora]